MKKIVFFITAITLFSATLQAQEHIHGCDLGEGYFSNTWIDPSSDEPIWYLYELVLWPDHNLCDLVAKYFYTEDFLPIYGIAAGLVTADNYETVINTSRDSAYEYFSLYDAGQDTLIPMSDSLYIHLWDTPVSYYLDMNCATISYVRTCPVYERYFDNPYLVIDSFYIGMTGRSANRVDGHDVYTSWPVKTFGFYTYPTLKAGDRVAEHYRWWRFAEEEYDSIWRAWDSLARLYDSTYVPGWQTWRTWTYIVPRLPDNNRIYFLFPILTPGPEDTTSHGGGDTLAVNTVQPFEKFVTVQPNPATEQVKVLSSFGMTHITAYDAAGVKVHEQPATGLSATLNVQGWPAGTYILHIQTPMGVSTKRLVVAR